MPLSAALSDRVSENRVGMGWNPVFAGPTEPSLTLTRYSGESKRLRMNFWG
tara:strand:+ start:519 stop:671 length:153 start_codon:yes stop_codon:yes gene_type:complete